MKIFEGEDIQQAAINLSRVARYAPYEYGGQWFATRDINEGFRFYRTKTACKKYALQNAQSEIFKINQD